MILYLHPRAAKCKSFQCTQCVFRMIVSVPVSCKTTRSRRCLSRWNPVILRDDARRMQGTQMRCFFGVCVGQRWLACWAGIKARLILASFENYCQGQLIHFQVQFIIKTAGQDSIALLSSARPKEKKQETTDYGKVDIRCPAMLYKKKPRKSIGIRLTRSTQSMILKIFENYDSKSK